ncbi:MAG: ABC transporter ATP-binding protein [Solirubrobacterales bacterium]
MREVPGDEWALVSAGVTLGRRGARIVSGVDLEIRRGEVVALLGPNGAGKSTLLRGLAGLEPLEAGSVRIGGRLASAHQTPALARRTVAQNIELALAWWGVPRGRRSARCAEAMAELGVSDLADRQAQALSGGESRRVHLARALAVRPDVLLLDEPFAGLDPSSRADLLYDAATALRDERRATLVVVHDRAEAWALADRVLVMLAGRIVAGGPPSEVLDHPPTPEVAEFVGFTGRLVAGSTIEMTRPSHVLVDPAGPLPARVVRRVPVEDGVRVELALEGGTLVAICPAPGPEPGARIRVRITGGARFRSGTSPGDPRSPSAADGVEVGGRGAG